MRYSKRFKARAVSRLLAPGADPDLVANAVGVLPHTLFRWRDELSLELRSSVSDPKIDRFAAILTTASMDDEARNAWCRSHGIYPSDLAQWRETAHHSLENPINRALDGSGSQRQRILDLERELRRKDKALAEAAALLVLSKKIDAIFHRDADD